MPQRAVVQPQESETDVLKALREIASTSAPTLVLKTAVNLLRQNFEAYSWVGIYLVKGDDLVLAAYAGEGETEHVRIPIGQGICGLAAKAGETVVVPDVNKDPRYLMCFPSTRSEIVVPIISGAEVLGEIDIDSDHLSAFSTKDQNFLEQAAAILATYLEKK